MLRTRIDVLYKFRLVMEATCLTVLFLLAVCIYVHLLTASYNTKFKRNVDLDGKICPAINVIFESQNCVNVRICVVQCNSRPNCASLFYQKGSHTCTLCDVIDGVMEELAGSVFYGRERGNI